MCRRGELEVALQRPGESVPSIVEESAGTPGTTHSWKTEDSSCDEEADLCDNLAPSADVTSPFGTVGDVTGLVDSLQLSGKGAMLLLV